MFVCLFLAHQDCLSFLQVTQVDHESVQVTAAKVIFDLLHMYGLEAFKAQQQEQEQGKEDEEEESADGSRSVTSSQPILGEEEEEGEDQDESNLDKATQRILNLLAEFLDKEVSPNYMATSIL